MKIAVYGPNRRVGALVGDQVIDLNFAYANYLNETQSVARPYAHADAAVPANLQGFIEEGDRAIEGAQRALDHQARRAEARGSMGEVIATGLANTKLHAPLPNLGSRIFMAAGNYADHVMGIRVHRAHQEVTVDQVFQDVRNAGISGFNKQSANVVGPYEDVIAPRTSNYFDYEGEVVVVFGKPAKDVSENQAASHYYGYTLQNDWSRRDVSDRASGLSMSIMKNFDTSSTLGPCIVVGEIPDAQNIDFETRVDGEVRQHGNTKDMVFNFAEYVAWVSRDQTIRVGDMLSAGTCAGTAMDATTEYDADGKAGPKLYIRPGQTVEVTSPQIGTIRNRIV